MKPWMIKLIIGAIGFGGGFAAGFFCHKKMNDVRIEEVTETEMDKILKESFVKESSSGDMPSVKPTQVTDEIGAAQKLPDDKDEMKNVLQGKKSFIEADKETKKAYDKLWKPIKEYSDEENANSVPVYPVEGKMSGDNKDAESESPGEEDFDENFLEQLEQEAVETGNAFVDPPHEIDLSEFYNGRPDYDKVTIRWFEPDNTWVDENDEVIADIESYTGTTQNVFSKPGMDGEEDIRFYRNDRYGTDYELIRHHRSWSEDTGE